MLDYSNSNNLSMYIGYIILDIINKKNKDIISIYDLSESLIKKGWKTSRDLTSGLLFLYSVDIIDFQEAQICVKK